MKTQRQQQTNMIKRYTSFGTEVAHIFEILHISARVFTEVDMQQNVNAYSNTLQCCTKPFTIQLYECALLILNSFDDCRKDQAFLTFMSFVAVWAYKMECSRYNSLSATTDIFLSFRGTV